MERVEHAAELADRIDAWRSAGERIAFVPTMGNLHAGHLSLIQAAGRCDRIVVSIFVNPLQFGEDEDLDSYPRTLAADLDGMRGLSRPPDLVFLPAERELYPHGREAATTVVPPAGLIDQLCGLGRPGHFTGVATVVARLFGLVRPDVAYFGRKDLQQVVVIRRMVEDLALPVEVVAEPTVREPDGLAMSSRNAYLDERQRRAAPMLYRILRETAEAVAGRGTDGLEAVERRAMERLAEAGFEPEYVKLRDPKLGPPTDAAEEWVVLGAARLGRARLIDNLSFCR